VTTLLKNHFFPSPNTEHEGVCQGTINVVAEVHISGGVGAKSTTDALGNIKHGGSVSLLQSASGKPQLFALKIVGIVTKD